MKTKEPKPPTPHKRMLEGMRDWKTFMGQFAYTVNGKPSTRREAGQHLRRTK